MSPDLIQQRKEMENQLRQLNRQADEMDGRIRAYLSDRQNKPHPHHREFILKIQNMRIDPRISTKHLETLLDNLQWKVYHYSQAWRQLWENAEARRRDERVRHHRRPGSHQTPPEQPGQERRIYSVDRLWQIQQEKLQALGQNPDAENRQAFVQRIKQRYGQLASEKGADEEIVMTFDKQSQRCTLAVKKRSSQS